MRTNQWIWGAGIALGMIACQPGADKPTAQEKLQAEIDQIEVEVETATGKNRNAQAERLVEHYKAYADQNPQDSLAPEFLFKAGNICIGLEDYDRAISFFDRIEKHFTNYLKRPEAMYMAGFVYDYHMGEKGTAKTRYERVIEVYPQHIFAKEARLAIDALYLTDEELIQKFEAANKEQAENASE